MTIRKVCFCLLPALLFCWSCQAERGHAPITPEEIEAHIRFLSDDLLEGRAVGSRGIAIAALYHENYFRGLGLEPAFGLSFRQTFTLLGSQPDVEASLEILLDNKSIQYEFAKDFLVGSSTKDTPEEVDGELVYCGYLIQAPERDWDDIKGTNLEGKILLVEINEPGNYPDGIFDGEDMTIYARWSSKIEKASELGAAGILIIHNTKGAGYGWEVVQNSWSQETFFLPDAKTKLLFEGMVHEQMAEKTLAAAGFEREELVFQAEKKEFKPVSLGLDIRLRQKPTFRSVSAENVAAILRGKNEKDNRRHIILSAHYDHIGRDLNLDGDQIYNGAVDNCSASATLLALARFYSQHRHDLEVDLVFVAVTAEESGLLGSDYFARHLPLPRSSALANLNFELTNVWGETEDVYAIGGKHSDLDDFCRNAAENLGLKYIPERKGELGYFFRSDQLSFARVGIPAVWLHEGLTSKGPNKTFIQEKERIYREKLYHQVTDEIEADWDLNGSVQIARWAQEIILLLSKQEEMPQFKSQSSFQRRN